MKKIAILFTFAFLLAGQLQAMDPSRQELHAAARVYAQQLGAGDAMEEPEEEMQSPGQSGYLAPSAHWLNQADLIPVPSLDGPQAFGAHEFQALYMTQEAPLTAQELSALADEIFAGPSTQAFCTIAASREEGHQSPGASGPFAPQTSVPMQSGQAGPSSAEAQEVRQSKKRKRPGERPFHCNHPDCTYASAYKNNLIMHQRIHTGERFHCNHPGCTKAYIQKFDLIKHQRTHTGERFHCNHPGCTKTCIQKRDLIRHQRAHTGERPFHCNHPGCPYASARKGDLIVHQRAHTGERPFHCNHPGCTKACIRKNDLIRHQRTHHGEIPAAPHDQSNLEGISQQEIPHMEEPEEEMQSPGPSEYLAPSAHGLNQADLIPVPSLDGPQAFGAHEFQALHVIAPLTDQELSALADEIFAGPSTQAFCAIDASREEGHQSPRTSGPFAPQTAVSVPMQSDQAGPSSAEAQEVRQSRNRPGERPFHCEHPGCTYASARKNNFIVHQRTHTGEKPFHCNHPDCTKACIQKFDLIRHQRTHTGERFRCNHPGCPYTYARKDDLIVHQRNHTGEKPFHCEHPDCTYASTHKINLIVHQRNHTGEKPFRCDHPGCTKSFEFQFDLNWHKEDHTENGCPECPKAFRQRRSLEKHMKIHHNRERAQNTPAAPQNQDTIAGISQQEIPHTVPQPAIAAALAADQTLTDDRTAAEASASQTQSQPPYNQDVGACWTQGFASYDPQNLLDESDQDEDL